MWQLGLLGSLLVPEKFNAPSFPVHLCAFSGVPALLLFHLPSLTQDLMFFGFFFGGEEDSCL